MKKLKKLKLQSAVLLDNPQMMAVRGGYCEIDGGELPEVTITCGANEGRCWDCKTTMAHTPFGPMRVTEAFERSIFQRLATEHNILMITKFRT